MYHWYLWRRGFRRTYLALQLHNIYQGLQSYSLISFLLCTSVIPKNPHFLHSFTQFWHKTVDLFVPLWQNFPIPLSNSKLWLNPINPIKKLYPQINRREFQWRWTTELSTPLFQNLIYPDFHRSHHKKPPLLFEKRHCQFFINHTAIFRSNHTNIRKTFSH